MTIRISGLVAEVTADLQFEYFEENRLFTDADGYSLEIELPLAGSEANRAIFGYPELTDLSSSMTWPMTIEAGGVNRVGMAVLAGIGEGTIKIQFLSGRSQSNFEARMESASLKDIRVDFYNETMPTVSRALASYDSQRLWNNYYKYNIEGVALPWINQSTGQRQNDIIMNAWHWAVREAGLSWMPYLISVARHAAIVAGYAYDFSEWEESPLRNLIVCNVLPVGMRNQLHYQIAPALPDWTILEFFRNIEPVLGGEFDIDHQKHRITFRDLSTVMTVIAPVRLDDVEDDYEVSSTFGQEETDGKYFRSKRYRYATPSVDGWAFYDCPWAPEYLQATHIKYYNTLQQALSAMAGQATTSNMFNAYHSAEHDAWFCFYQHDVNEDGSGGAITIRPFNLFGPQKAQNDADYQELKVVPVMMDNGVPLLNAGEGYDMIAHTIDGSYLPDRVADSDYAAQYVCEVIGNGEQTGSTSVYSHLFVAYWPGYDATVLNPYQPSVAGFRYAVADGVARIAEEPWSMRLNDDSDGPYGFLPKIDESVKYTFHFHTDHLPDVRAVFHINGKRYICGKMVVGISAIGASRRVKGEFYRIQE